MSAVHDLSAQALSGRTVDFAAFTGKPLLIVNVASL
jgi:glutathione peroxidase-family protein